MQMNLHAFLKVMIAFGESEKTLFIEHVLFCLGTLLVIFQQSKYI